MGLVGSGNTSEHYTKDMVYVDLKLGIYRTLHELDDMQIDALSFKEARTLLVYCRDYYINKQAMEGCLRAIVNKWYKYNKGV